MNSKREMMLFVLLLAPAFFWFHAVCDAVTGDTVIFLDYLSRMTIPELLKFRLEHFTTRIILEALLFLFLKLPSWCFILANTAMLLLTAGLLGYYGACMGTGCSGEKREPFHPFLLAAFLFLLYPLGDLTAAGIPPAFINYVWSGGFGLLALLPPVLFLRKKEAFYGQRGMVSLCGRCLLWLLSGAACLAGANMEQMAVILLLVTLAFGTVLFIRGKRRQAAWMAGLFILSLISLLFHLTGGNAERLEISIEAYWPKFRELTLFDKALNGIITTTNHLLSIPNMIFLSFAWLLALLAVEGRREEAAGGAALRGRDRGSGRGKRLLWYTAGVAPLVHEGLVLLAKLAGAVLHMDLQKWLNGVKDPYTDAAVSPAGAWLPLVWQLAVLVMAVLFLCLVLDTVFWRAVVIGLLGAGFASRVMMGFSPTLFMSHTRTFYFFYLTILTADLILAAGPLRRSRRGYRIYFYSMAALGCANFIRAVLKAAEVMDAF